MKRVIKIDEECHGFVGLAATPADAAEFMMEVWDFNKESEVYNDSLKDWETVKNVMLREGFLPPLGYHAVKVWLTEQIKDTLDGIDNPLNESWYFDWEEIWGEP